MEQVCSIERLIFVEQKNYKKMREVSLFETVGVIE